MPPPPKRHDEHDVLRTGWWKRLSCASYIRDATNARLLLRVEEQKRVGVAAARASDVNGPNAAESQVVEDLFQLRGGTRIRTRNNWASISWARIDGCGSGGGEHCADVGVKNCKTPEGIENAYTPVGENTYYIYLIFLTQLAFKWCLCNA